MTEASPKSSRRRYHAPVRQAHADLTRRKIIDAATEVFTERGFAASTMEAIAVRAQVSVPTLYGTFGGKQQILSSAVLELKKKTGVYESVQQLMTCSDPVELLRRAAAVVVQFNAVAWQLLDVLRAGAQADADLASLWDTVEESRYRDQETIARRFAEMGVLTSDLSVAQSAAIFWTLTAHDQYRLLVVDRGWSGEELETWLAKTLQVLLLRRSKPMPGNS